MKTKKCPLKRLRDHVPMLHVLRNAHPKMRRAIINNADNSLLLTLGECSLNVLNSNQPLSDECKRKLKKYKQDLRQLAAPSRRVPYKRKRAILQQRGGFIIPTILGTLLSGIISKLV